MREITLSKLKESGVETQSVKDNSVRGITTKYTSEVKVSDMVVLNNYFTLVIDEPEAIITKEVKEMNYKTTKRDILNGYSNVIYTGYCNLQHLLYYKNPESHTERREGWGADIYLVNDNTCIVTGYAPFGNIKAEYTVCKKYNDMAKNIMTRGNEISSAADIDVMINQFVQEVTQ